MQVSSFGILGDCVMEEYVMVYKHAQATEETPETNSNHTKFAGPLMVCITHVKTNLLENVIIALIKVKFLITP
jgi:hypothetical protein